MSIGKATESGHADYGTAWGTITENTPAQATWNVFVGLGSMAFAYSFVSALPSLPVHSRRTMSLQRFPSPWLRF